MIPYQIASASFQQFMFQSFLYTDMCDPPLARSAPPRTKAHTHTRTHTRSPESLMIFE